MTAVRRGDWRESANMVLSELERLDREHRECRKHLLARLEHIEIEVALLNQKARLWGLVGGMIPVLVTLGIGISFKLFNG